MLVRTNTSTAPVDRVIGTREAAAMMNFSIPHFRTLYRTGKVPKPIKLSERKLGWRLFDLERWLAEKSEEAAA
jgi:predicted DNA-binding transcriptional regulator AlpA